MKRLILILLVLCWVFPALATEEKPTIGLPDNDKYPIINQPTQIMVSHASYPDLTKFEVKVTYRPNSMVKHEKTIGHPDSNGRLSWTPHDAGICVIEAVAPALEGDKPVSISSKVSVRYGSFPILGLIVMIFAAFTLFGGLIFSFSKLKDTPA